MANEPVGVDTSKLDAPSLSMATRPSRTPSVTSLRATESVSLSAVPESASVDLKVFSA